jgi:hypothetical protein
VFLKSKTFKELDDFVLHRPYCDAYPVVLVLLEKPKDSLEVTVHR